MTETQERFLKAVADRVPLERVAEVYLFPAIRQGGVETGLAVVAAERWADDLPAAAPGDERVADATATAGEGERTGEGVRDDASRAAPEARIVERVVETEVAAADARADLPTARDAGPPPQLQDGPADVGGPHPAAAPNTDFPRARPADDPPARHTIFSARYRLALKGPDRGKWEVDVVAEADAPLVTLDAVVRGIRKRTGEAADAERVPRDVLRELTAHPA